MKINIQHLIRFRAIAPNIVLMYIKGLFKNSLLSLPSLPSLSIKNLNSVLQRLKLYSQPFCTFMQIHFCLQCGNFNYSNSLVANCSTI